MPATKKNHGHENDLALKGQNQKSKSGKMLNERSRPENLKSGETMNTHREGIQGKR